jgi:hypothetical protein
VFGRYISWWDVMWCVNSGNLSILPWWFDRWYNRTHVSNQDFEIIIRLYTCVECSITFIFGISKTSKSYFRPSFILPYQTILKRDSVFVRLLLWYDVGNLECFILPGWLEETFNRSILPHPNIKRIVSSVIFCRMFHIFIFSVLVIWKRD